VSIFRNILSLIILIAPFVVIGAEVDQYTFREEEIKDSSELLNEKSNASISKAVQLANTTSLNCDENALYDELRVYFNNHIKGKLTKDIIQDENISKRFVSLKDSVYQDWTLWDGIGMGSVALNKTVVTMSGEMKVGEHYIGVDKLEHMFGQGFFYFKQNYLSEKGIVKSLKTGVAKEKTILGGNKIGNGVFSYGDLSANFNGMRFWNHVLLKNDDILGADRNLGPYIICSNDKWKQVEKVDFKNYMDDSMDEGINCPKFPSHNTAEKFANRLKLMGKTCPMNLQKRDDLVVKYRHIAKWIINTEGIGKVKYTGEFRNKK
jgi:hypothetical protein